MTPDRAPAGLVAAVAVAVALAAVAGPVAAGVQGSGDPAPRFVVALSATGTADVTVTLTYDLATDDERAAFASLRDDEAARTALADRFRDRLAAVAADAENRTGRSMAVRDPAVEVSTTDDGGTGVVELSVVWEGLAAVEGDRLVVTEPFASGFEPDRRFAVVGPDGYRLDGATPAPDDAGAARAAWEPGTALDGFEATFAPAGGTGTPTATATAGDPGTATGTAPPDGPSIPGFGWAAAVAALAAALAARRRGQ